MRRLNKRCFISLISDNMCVQTDQKNAKKIAAQKSGTKPNKKSPSVSSAPVRSVPFWFVREIIRFYYRSVAHHPCPPPSLLLPPSLPPPISTAVSAVRCELPATAATDMSGGGPKPKRCAVRWCVVWCGVVRSDSTVRCYASIKHKHDK